MTLAEIYEKETGKKAYYEIGDVIEAPDKGYRPGYSEWMEKQLNKSLEPMRFDYFGDIVFNPIIGKGNSE